MATVTKEKSKIYLTKQVTYKDARSAANTEGKVMGNTNVWYYLDFIKSLRGSGIFVDPSGLPKDLKADTTYYLDARSHTMSEKRPKDLKPKWYKIVYIDKSVLQAIKEARPLSLSIAYGHGYRYRLLLDGNSHASDVARATQVEAGHEAAAPQFAVALRTEETIKLGYYAIAVTE